MVHSEVYLNKYVVSIAPFSTSACPDCSQNMLLLLKSVEFDDDVALLLSHKCCRSCHGTACDFGVRNRRHRLCCTEDIADLSSALWKLCDELHVVLQR